MNSYLKRIVMETNCSIYVGDKGSGKSTLMALACDTFLKIPGFKVFCNYPYKGAFQIPYKTIVDKKYGDKIILDKDFLYRADLRNSLVMIDEARTVWNARSYAQWTEQDEEFFNFIRKNNTYVILATQRYDGIDLNCRCAADMTFFIQRHSFFKNVSTVDISRSCQVKIADKNTEVVSRGYTKGAQKVVWDVAEMPIKYTWFYRKPYYKDFDTRFINREFALIDFHTWEEVLKSDDIVGDVELSDVDTALDFVDLDKFA